MNEAEKKFEAENGMSSAEAWNFVLQWKKEGKNPEAKNGCEEILRYFPNHQEARMMLTKIEEETEEQAPVHTAKKKGKLPGAIQNIIKKASAPQEALPGMEVPNEKEKFWGAFSYAYFLVVVPLVLSLIKKDSAFIEFHSLQGVILSAMTFLCFTFLLPFFSFFGLGMIMYALGTLLVLIHLFSLLQAFRGGWFKIPMIYEFSQKLKSYL